MGLSNEISFILIFLAVPVQQVKMFCSKLAVRRCMSTSVTQVCKNFFNSQNNLNNSLKKASVWPYWNIILTLYICLKKSPVM